MLGSHNGYVYGSACRANSSGVADLLAGCRSVSRPGTLSGEKARSPASSPPRPRLRPDKHTRTLSDARTPLRHAALATAHSGLCSDGYMTYDVTQKAHKPWAARLMIPYLVAFAIASLTSLATVVMKIQLVREKLHSRGFAHGPAQQQWNANVLRDQQSRQAWMHRFTSSAQLYTDAENAILARGTALLGPHQLPNVQSEGPPPPFRSRTRVDPESRRVIGATEGVIEGASPLEIMAFLMLVDSCFFQSRSNINAALDVRLDLLEHINDHHAVVFVEKAAAPFDNRTFLNAMVVKELSEDGTQFLFSTAPIASHPRIRPEDERHAVRGEAMRFWRVTRLTSSQTYIEYAACLDLKGSFPPSFTNSVAIPQLRA